MIPVLIKLRGDVNELKGRVADLEAKVMEMHDRLFALEGGPPNYIGQIEPPPGAPAEATSADSPVSPQVAESPTDR
jgi:hypothetical protein